MTGRDQLNIAETRHTLDHYKPSVCIFCRRSSDALKSMVTYCKEKKIE